MCLRTAANAGSVAASTWSMSPGVVAADTNQLCRGCKNAPRRTASLVNTFASAKSWSPVKVRNGIWTGPVCLTGSSHRAACPASPSRSACPRATMVATASSCASASSVASDAAIDTAENQNDPVVNTSVAPPRNRSLPSRAASA
jgi:hypothetical protein